MPRRRRRRHARPRRSRLRAAQRRSGRSTFAIPTWPSCTACTPTVVHATAPPTRSGLGVANPYPHLPHPHPQPHHYPNPNPNPDQVGCLLAHRAELAPECGRALGGVTSCCPAAQGPPLPRPGHSPPLNPSAPFEPVTRQASEGWGREVGRVANRMSRGVRQPPNPTLTLRPPCALPLEGQAIPISIPISPTALTRRARPSRAAPTTRRACSRNGRGSAGRQLHRERRRLLASPPGRAALPAESAAVADVALTLTLTRTRTRTRTLTLTLTLTRVRCASSQLRRPTLTRPEPEPEPGTLTRTLTRNPNPNPNPLP